MDYINFLFFFDKSVVRSRLHICNIQYRLIFQKKSHIWYHIRLRYLFLTIQHKCRILCINTYKIFYFIFVRSVYNLHQLGLGHTIGGKLLFYKIHCLLTSVQFICSAIIIGIGNPPFPDTRKSCYPY